MWAVFFSFFLAGVNFVWGLDTQTFDGEVRDFAVGDTFVYVVTDDRLYQLNHHFTNVTTREEHHFRVNILLPFIKNKTLITCGSKTCGYCEILDLNNISKSVHFEDILVGSSSRSSSIGFIVDVGTESFIMAGNSKAVNSVSCPDNKFFLVLRNTQEGQNGGTFSISDDGSTSYIDTRKKESFHFVDGFQISSYIYLFSNVPEEHNVRLTWFRGTTGKAATLKSFRGANLWCCDDMERRRLLSSSVIPSPSVPQGKVLWAGVFTGNHTLDPVNTVLAVFDISPSAEQTTDPDLCFGDCLPNKPTTKLIVLKPLMVVFKYSSMTSVLAARHNSWIIFFIGTQDGQLIKLAVDKNNKVACPRVLYKSADDLHLFPKMHLDPVDSQHVYMALRNEIMRVPVAQCSGHKGLKECWLAQDPYCGWCMSESRCSFLYDCLPPSNWISIPDDYNQQRIVSHQVEKGSSGEKITLTAKVHLNVIGTESPLFACNFAGDLCDTASPGPEFPQCYCLFSSGKLPAKGLDVSVKIRVGKAALSEKLMLTNCSDITGPPTFDLCSRCMTAGCSWNNNACSWTGSANSGPIQDICRHSQSGMNYSEPEIVSIEPSVLSFHGKNQALMTGKNLDHVVRVHMQSHISCLPNESPVWNHTDSNLTFHIPSGDKGSVSVCVVLPDGRCVGKATVTYRSSPTCTGLSPANTWASGNRRISILGSHLEFVEGVVHAGQIITTHYSSGELWYHTPPYGVEEDLPVTTSVSLRVANQTLACASQLTYHHDPQFTSFTTTRTGNDLRVTIEKKTDKFNITPSEISVLGVLGDNQYVECVMEIIETRNGTDSVICKIKNTPNVNILSLEIRIGHFTINLKPPTTSFLQVILVVITIIIIIIIIISGVVWYFYSKQRKMAALLDRQLEELECDFRNDAGQG
ncbi:plexin-C1 isoform X1 [Esox lucius]|uniref:Sema domain-containing protein n=1 Tax=Esox lucius TaxID=8010 RepID=A0AAY5L1H4_ESOLU|nr:plexin-C1 isoform X1 [Esox lucius]